MRVVSCKQKEMSTRAKLHICQKHMNGLMTNLHVSFAKDPRKDNIVMII